MCVCVYACKAIHLLMCMCAHLRCRANGNPKCAKPLQWLGFSNGDLALFSMSVIPGSINRNYHCSWPSNTKRGLWRLALFVLWQWSANRVCSSRINRCFSCKLCEQYPLLSDEIIIFVANRED